MGEHRRRRRESYGFAADLIYVGSRQPAEDHAARVRDRSADADVHVTAINPMPMRGASRPHHAGSQSLHLATSDRAGGDGALHPGIDLHAVGR